MFSTLVADAVRAEASADSDVDFDAESDGEGDPEEDVERVDRDEGERFREKIPD